jgi:hypothetical protein
MKKPRSLRKIHFISAAGNSIIQGNKKRELGGQREEEK